MTTTARQKNKRVVCKSLKNAPLHPEEQKRLAALSRYRIIDTSPESGFDEITYLLTAICKTPIAWIGFIDERRQWFKSKVGLTLSEIPRELAFCSHAVLQPDQVMVVGDMQKDDRFCDNPFVQGFPYIRFYAGVPLLSAEGEPIGTVGVLDHSPRSLQEYQLQALQVFSHKIMTALELRVVRQDLDLVKEQARLEVQFAQKVLTQLEATHKTLESVTQAISHDLRTPLRSIDSFTKVLLEDYVYSGKLDADARSYLQRIQSNSHHLGLVLEELVSLSCITPTETHSLPIDLSALAREIVDTLQDAIPESHCQFVCAPKVTAIADPDRMAVVLRYLLQAAWQLADHESTPRVEFGGAMEAGEYFYFVRSHGCGFPTPNQDRPTNSRQFPYSLSGFPGSAIGWVTAQRIIDHYEGKLWIESTEEGVTFFFTLRKGTA